MASKSALFPCSVCNTPTDKYCSCHMHYCSPACQSSDRSAHKKICSHLKLVKFPRCDPEALRFRPFAKSIDGSSVLVAFALTLKALSKCPGLASELQKAPVPCSGCGQPTKKSCGRCRIARYCSIECQSADEGHKEVCVPAPPAQPLMGTIGMIPGRGFVHTRAIPIIPFDVADEAKRDLVELLFAAIPGRTPEDVCVVCSSTMSLGLFKESHPSPGQICLAVLECAGEFSTIVRHADSCNLSTHLLYECIRLRFKSLGLKCRQYCQDSYALHVQKFMLGGPALMVAGKAELQVPTAAELAEFEELYARAG